MKSEYLQDFGWSLSSTLVLLVITLLVARIAKDPHRNPATTKVLKEPVIPLLTGLTILFAVFSLLLLIRR